MLKTCSKCGEEFELLPGKPGYANVCPTCTKNPEEKARKAAEDEALQKSLKAARKENARRREKDRAEDIKLESLGFRRVPGKRITIQVPIKSSRKKGVEGL